jgi:hypothetical protein
MPSPELEAQHAKLEGKTSVIIEDAIASGHIKHRPAKRKKMSEIEKQIVELQVGPVWFQPTAGPDGEVVVVWQALAEVNGKVRKPAGVLGSQQVPKGLAPEQWRILSEAINQAWSDLMLAVNPTPSERPPKPCVPGQLE